MRDATLKTVLSNPDWLDDAEVIVVSVRKRKFFIDGERKKRVIIK